MPEENKKRDKIKSFVLRMDTDTLDAVQVWAEEEFRSLNGQIQWIIEQALIKEKRKKNKTK